MHFRNPHQPNGSALLTALFVMTLMAITATAMLSRLRLDVMRTTQVVQSDQRCLAAQLVPFWAISQLRQQRPIFAVPDAAGVVLTLPKTMETLYPGVRVKGVLYDLQARFNLNNLKIPAQQALFQQLIQARSPTMNKNLIQMIVMATTDWISPEAGAGQDKWSQYYAAMRPPYQAAHQLFVSVSELSLVSGITPTLYQRLSPFLTALPGVALINVNTVPMALLAAISPDLPDSKLKQIIDMREQGEIHTEEAFTQFLKEFQIRREGLGFQSQYYLAKATVLNADQPFELYTILKRVEVHPAEWSVQIVRESAHVL